MNKMDTDVNKQKKAKKGKKTTNWDLLYTQYLKTDHFSAQDFLKEVLNPYKESSEGHYSRKTREWKKKKQEFHRKRTEALSNGLADKEEIEMVKRLKEMKKTAIILVKNKLAEQSDKMTIGNIKDALNIIKTELGEPTTITNQKIENRNSSAIEGLDREERELKIAELQKKLDIKD